MIMKTISWQEFEQVDLRIGTVVEAKLFPEARKPAYILHVDFGPEVGMLKSSAQITDLYSPDDLVGRQVLGVVNFPKKQIGPVRSECLITGFTQADGSVVLAQPAQSVANGAQTCLIRCIVRPPVRYPIQKLLPGSALHFPAAPAHSNVGRSGICSYRNPDDPHPLLNVELLYPQLLPFANLLQHCPKA